MNNAFWSHFKHFGRLLGKIYLFLPSRKTDGRIPSQQGAPTTCNLTLWEVSQPTYVQTLLTSFAVVIGKNSDLQWAEGGGGGGLWVFGRTMGVAKGRNSPLQWAEGRGKRFLINNTEQLFQTSNTFRNPELYFSQQKPAKLRLKNRSNGSPCYKTVNIVVSSLYY